MTRGRTSQCPAVPARGLRGVGFALALLLGCVDERETSVETVLADCAAAGGAKCGLIRVPENPEASDGRTIELAVVVVPASGDDPQPSPVFVLAGGPGQGAASLAQYVAPRLALVGRSHDLVFVDLRGTGASSPLECEFEDYESLGDLLAAKVHPERVAGCLTSYADADLRRYSTEQQMADLEQVRAELGYEQINLLAISYGTRAALTYVKRHPERVRSMVLDGVVPLDVDVYKQIPASSEQALARVLADCRDDVECSAVYPGLERELEQVLTELATLRRLIEVPHPRSGVIERVEVTREGFLGALRMALYSPDSSALIPLIIHAAHRGDFGPIAALTLASSRNAKSLSLGLYLTISCAEEMQGVDAAALHEAVAGLRWFGDQSLLELADICKQWTPAAVPPDVREPTHATAPTLLLSGAYDPVTPPRFGEHVAAQLGDARHVVIEHGHHSLSWRGCAPRLLAEFFADPRPATLDAACMTEQPARRFFLSPNGPRRLRGQVEPPRLLGDDRPELATKEPER